MINSIFFMMCEHYLGLGISLLRILACFAGDYHLDFASHECILKLLLRRICGVPMFTKAHVLGPTMIGPFVSLLGHTTHAF